MHKTGFFHVQRGGDRWILVNPVGNAFFHLGICSFGCSEDYTYCSERVDPDFIRRIHDVWLDGDPPYVFEHPRFTGGQGDTVRSVRAGHAIGPMAIDGQLAGWPGRPPERIAPDRLTVGRDSKGLEASFKVCWDEDAFYLLADVSDPTPMQNQHSGAELWSADGLELFIGGEALDQGGPLRFTDRQILIGAGSSDGQRQFHVVNAPPATQRQAGRYSNRGR